MPPVKPPPYFAVDTSWWEVVLAGLTRPIPEEAALIDLRWHDDRVRLDKKFPPRGRSAHKMPGRPALVKAWGWDGTVKGHTPYAVGELLADTARWASPLDGAAEDRQENGSADTGERRESSENRQRFDSAPDDPSSTADRQRIDIGSTAIQQRFDSGDEDERRESPDNRQRFDSDSAADRQQSGSVSTARPGDLALDAANNAHQTTNDRPHTGQSSLFPPTPRAETAEQQVLLRILRRWAGAQDAPRPWVVDYGEALGWFALAIVAEYGSEVDIHRALQDWEAALEDEARRFGRPGTSGQCRFPRVWKNGLRNWIRVRAERAGETRHERPPTPPPAPRGRGAARGRLGDAPTLNVRTVSGAGSDDDPF